jgi:hypothetical protein
MAEKQPSPVTLAGLTLWLANTPVNSIPTIPPTPWQGNTSSVSSIEVRVRHSTTRLLTTADIIPIASECGTVTKPAAGVMATKPTTAPIQVPIADGLRPRSISKNIQVTPAAADAVVLVAKRLPPNGWHQMPNPR